MVIALASTFTPSFSATGARRSRRSDVLFTSVRPRSVKLLRTTYTGMAPSVRSEIRQWVGEPVNSSLWGRSWRGVSLRRRQIGLVQLRQSQLVRADVAAQNRESGEMRLQSSGTGTAVHQHDRLDTHVEQVHAELQDAHVGVQADDPDLLDAVFADTLGERLWHASQTLLGKDIAVFRQRRQLLDQLGFGRAGTRVPVTQRLVRRALTIDEQGVQHRRV